MNIITEYYKHLDDMLARQGKTPQQRMVMIGGGAAVAVLAIFGLLYLLSNLMQSVISNARFD